MPNIGLYTSIFNTTQICLQHFRNVICGNVRGASTKYWSYNHHIQQYKNTPTVLQKLHACLLGMCVVLVPNIGISTSISNTTQIRPQQIINFMCVHWECAWCQYQILVLEPPYIQHYTNMLIALQKLNVLPLGMYVVLVPNISLRTNISNTTQIRPEYFGNFMLVHWECTCVVLVPNIGISTSVSNTTQIRPQHLRNFMCVHWECAWCQCQMLVFEPPYPTLHKYAHST